MAAAVGALLVAVSLLSGCANDGERQWRVAADPRATADEIIDAGHAADIATNGDQMVVTWEVEPEDDEGPYQGAWRLYDREPLQIAEGKFGTVREASARIDVTAVRGGFLLTDYAKGRQHFLDRKGRLTPAALSTAKPGSSLAGGVLLESDASGEPTWQVLLPGSAGRSVGLVADPECTSGRTHGGRNGVGAAAVEGRRTIPRRVREGRQGTMDDRGHPVAEGFRGRPRRILGLR